MVPFRWSSGHLALLAILCISPYLRAQSTPTIDAPSDSGLPPHPSTSITVFGNPNDVPKALIRAEGDREVKVEETQRIAAVVPNFYTVIDGEGVPLDKTQKTALAWRATIDPFNVVGAFVIAGESELQGTYRGYGWGAPGYFKRTGANLADVADGTMLAGAVYPILLHQDPRYFRQGAGPIRSRIRHALLGAFICRGDSGRSQFNASNILGNFTAGAIANAYHPPADRGFSLTVASASVVTLEGALGTIALEFSPDIQAWWHNRKHPPNHARNSPD